MINVENSWKKVNWKKKTTEQQLSMCIRFFETLGTLLFYIFTYLYFIAFLSSDQDSVVLWFFLKLKMSHYIGMIWNEHNTSTCFHCKFVSIFVYLHSIFHCWCNLTSVNAWCHRIPGMSIIYCSSVSLLFSPHERQQGRIMNRTDGATEKLNTRAFKHYRPRLNDTYAWK